MKKRSVMLFIALVIVIVYLVLQSNTFVEGFRFWNRRLKRWTMQRRKPARRSA